jgi:hypothetical protein
MLNRIKIIQRLIGVIEAENYLEIGVNNGACFLRIRAGYKMAVDPSFQIAPGRKLKYFIKNPRNFNNQYFEQTSDDFFASQKSIIQSHKPKLVFVDGLHTYEQALRDVLNSLSFLDDGGIILMHDCNPLTEAAALPAESIDDAKRKLKDYGGIWNGDVWKAIVHLRSLHADLEVFVLDCDHGIGFVRRAIPEKKLDFSQQEIQRLSYHDLEKNRSTFLNLKSPDYFEDFVGRLAAENS